MHVCFCSVFVCLDLEWVLPVSLPPPTYQHQLYMKMDGNTNRSLPVCNLYRDTQSMILSFALAWILCFLWIIDIRSDSFNLQHQ